MKKLLFIIVFFPVLSFAQTVISSNTLLTVGENTIVSTNASLSNRSSGFNFLASRDNSNLGGLAFVGTDQFIHTVGVTNLPNLWIDGGGIKPMLGTFVVSNELALIDGIVSTLPFGDGENFLAMLPSARFNDDLDGSSYVIGAFVHFGAGDKFFPVGGVTASEAPTYAPAMLEGIRGTDNTVTAMQAFRNDGSFTPSGTPDNLNSISTDWLWGVFGENFTSANITLPIQAEDANLVDGDDLKFVIIETDTDGAATQNLGGSTTSFVSRSGVSSTTDILNPGGVFKRSYLLGTESTIVPLVHNIITPNNDGANDFLVIENLDAFGKNEIILIDRYGVKVFAFKDYVSPDPSGTVEAADFTFLPPGNYICILKYNDGKNTIKQTISVIK